MRHHRMAFFDRFKTGFAGDTATGLSLQFKAPEGLQMPDGTGAGNLWHRIASNFGDWFTGSWQQNRVLTPLVDVLQNPCVFACITLIASDLGKIRWELVRHIGNDVWEPVENPAFSPILRRPNHFQTDFQFREQWGISLLEWGNTYVFKQRDARGVVSALHILDPCRVRPLVAPDGSVFYELKMDRLAQQPADTIVVPAREIIHDHFNELFHPLVGISPLYAAGIPAMLGLKISTSSTQFFGNGSTPGGILYVPGVLDQAKADDLKTRWEQNFGGVNQGRTAVIPDGMKFEPINVPNDKSQMTEQNMAACQAIATAFHVPFYMVGGPYPPYNNIQAQSVEYLSRCLQPRIVGIETAMDEGLGIRDRINGVQYGVQFKVNDLLLMDTQTLMAVNRDGVASGIFSPNDSRAQFNYGPVSGGDTPYLQQQNFSLSALARRDAQDSLTAPTAPPQSSDQAQVDITDATQAAAWQGRFKSALECAT